MPNFPSIYLELQELWKRYKSITNSLSSVNDNLSNYNYNNLSVSFSSNSGDLPSIQANVIGGVPPYSYNWAIIQGNYNIRKIISPTNSSSVVLIKNLDYHNFVVDDSTILKLEVTDSQQNKNSFIYNHKVIGYEPMTLNIGLPITANYCSEGNMLTVSVPWVGANFLDTIFSNDVYYSLEKCSNFNVNNIISTKYRNIRECIQYNISQKILFDHKNYNLKYYITEIEAKNITSFDDNANPTEVISTIDVEQFNVLLNNQISSSLNFSKQAVFHYTQEFRKINFLIGVKPQYYTLNWNSNRTALDNKSIKDHIGMSRIKYLDEIGSGDPLPSVGYAGELIKKGDTVYAWSSLEDSWSVPLAEAIENILATIRAKRDAHIMSSRELFLSINPFIYAALHFPLHRIR